MNVVDEDGNVDSPVAARRFGLMRGSASPVSSVGNLIDR